MGVTGKARLLKQKKSAKSATHHQSRPVEIATSKKTVFVACSTPAIPLAEGLARYLERRLKSGVEIRRWWDNQFRLGKSLFTSLANHTKECDFAVVCLTKDDFAEKKGQEVFLPRDNTILELGLFAGELGIERCLIVCGIEAMAVPIDIDGIKLAKIPSKFDIGRKTDLARAIEEVGPEVLQAIEGTECFEHPKLPVISKEQLGRLEKPKPKGNLALEPGTTAVVVNSVQPVEKDDPQFCLSVQNNLKANARYEYYFGKFDAHLPRTIEMVRNIALAGLTPTNPPTTQYVEALKANMKCLQANLSIHFRSRPPLQFCVHNATSDEEAICYLRCHGKFKGNFVRWAEGDEATEVAEELRTSCTDPIQESAIFHSTRDVLLSLNAVNFCRGFCDLNKTHSDFIELTKKIASRRETMKNKIRGIFPENLPEDAYDYIISACIGAEQ